MAASGSTALCPVFLLQVPPSHLPDTASFLSFRSLHGRLRPPPPLFLRRTNLRSAHSPSRRLSPVVAVQSNFFKVIQTAWKIGRDATEAGANLVPDAVPRPIARIGVATVAAIIALFILKSFVSTVFFVLAVMGLVYFVFVALNTDEISPRSEITTSSEEETLEEARRIMEKYK
ncbi:hypothetical protein Cni_G27043 [Canna indica]|uniref:Uncharacterized protein n=1 Tax=Canna indica TaxID=4628 RepID=A0AAQ3L0T0_9LILI|nr:hypothetical protein Cni_G27043 [Canna indica]